MSMTTRRNLLTQEDLSISNGDNVGGNVSRHITTLGLNDGQSSERTTTELVVHLGRTLEKTRVEVEDVTGVSLTARRTPQKQGHLTVGDGLLRQIVVDDESVLSVVTEPLAHGATGEGSNVLQRGSLGSSSGDNDGVLHGVVLLKSLDELSDGGSLLTDGNVDTVELLGLVVT